VEFFALLLVLRIQHVILVSVIRRFKRNLFIFSRNCLTTTNFVRRLITSIWCRPRSRKLLYFKNGKYVHFIFCRYLSSISVFAVPSCSLVEFNNQQESGRDFFERFKALCTLVFERQFVVSWLLRLFQVGILWIPIQWVLLFPVLSPTANTCTWRRQLVITMTEELLLKGCAKSSHQLVQVSHSISFSSSWSLRPYSCAWFRTDARSSNITGQFTPKFCSSLAISHNMDFSQRVYT